MSDLPQHPVIDPRLGVLGPLQSQSIRETFPSQLQHLRVRGSGPGVNPRQDEEAGLAQNLGGKGLDGVAEETKLYTIRRDTALTHTHTCCT